MEVRNPVSLNLLNIVPADATVYSIVDTMIASFLPAGDSNLRKDIRAQQNRWQNLEFPFV
jgi:hypothetical protein